MIEVLHQSTSTFVISLLRRVHLCLRFGGHQVSPPIWSFRARFVLVGLTLTLVSTELWPVTINGARQPTFKQGYYIICWRKCHVLNRVITSRMNLSGIDQAAIWIIFVWFIPVCLLGNPIIKMNNYWFLEQWTIDENDFNEPENILTCCRSIHRERSAPARCCRPGLCRLFLVELLILAPLASILATLLDWWVAVKAQLVTTKRTIQNEKIMMNEPSWRSSIQPDPTASNKNN